MTEIKELVKKAQDSITAAEALLQKSFPGFAASRAYYAMFYAVLALLVYEEFSSSKHSGVLSYFNRRFIKDGVFDKSLGLSLAKAFELRQRVDYRERIELKEEAAQRNVEQAERFVKEVTVHLVALGRM